MYSVSNPDAQKKRRCLNFTFDKFIKNLSYLGCGDCEGHNLLVWYIPLPFHIILLNKSRTDSFCSLGEVKNINLLTILLMGDAHHTRHDYKQRPMAVCHLSELGDLIKDN